MTKIHTKYAVFASFVTMLFMAMSHALRGMLVPTFKDVFQIGNAEIGWLISTTTLVTMAVSYIGSILASRYGQKPVMLVAVVINGVSYFATSLAQSYTGLFASYIGVTIGTALLIISMNTMLPLLRIQAQTLIMNLLHFFFGFGVTISQKVSGHMLTFGTNWRTLFQYCVILFVINLIILLPMKGPSGTGKVRTRSQKPIPNKPLLLLIIMALGFYVAAEFHTGNWFVNYLKDTYGYTENGAAFFASLFFGTFTVGRLVGGFVSQKFGALRSIVVCVISAAFLYTTGLLLGEPGLYIVSGSGLFFGLIYPTMLVVTAEMYPETSVKVIGILTTATNVIAFTTGLMMGYMNDWVGTERTYWMIPTYLVISMVMFIMVYRRRVECIAGQEKAAA